MSNGYAIHRPRRVQMSLMAPDAEPAGPCGCGCILSGGFRGHGTYFTPRRVKPKLTSAFIVNNISGPGRKSNGEERSRGVAPDPLPRQWRAATREVFFRILRRRRITGARALKASLTAMPSGKTSRTSCPTTTTFVPSAYRAAVLPRAAPEKSYSGRIVSWSQESLLWLTFISLSLRPGCSPCGDEARQWRSLGKRHDNQSSANRHSEQQVTSFLLGNFGDILLISFPSRLNGHPRSSSTTYPGRDGSQADEERSRGVEESRGQVVRAVSLRLTAYGREDGGASQRTAAWSASDGTRTEARRRLGESRRAGWCGSRAHTRPSRPDRTPAAD